MKTNFNFIFILFLSIQLHSQQWNLVWSDEFSNPPINASNWTFEQGAGGWGNNELEHYTNRPVNATIYGGNLLIIARKESYNGSNYTSARMKTENKQYWTYGKIEARIKLPVGKGIWPAFWMLGNNIGQVGWPACGEIDIMEHINTETKTYGTIHWDNNGHANYGGNTPCVVTSYHVYAIEWDSLSIKWFLDGTKFWEANIAGSINSTGEFHKPQFIILNMAVGGNWPGNPDATTSFPDTMFVDYVRVYKKTTTTAMPEQNEKELNVQLMPNPAGDVLEALIPQADHGEYNVEVYDVLGNSCHREQINVSGDSSHKFLVSTASLRPGIYFLSLRKGEKSISLRFIRQ